MPQESKKKIQLRRCASCQKIGHNRSTCQEIAAPAITTSAKATPAPLKFFVHHVDHQPTPSPHVLDLKHDAYSAWKNVEPSSPEIPPTLYHSYHQFSEPVALPPPSKPEAVPLFVDLKPARKIQAPPRRQFGKKLTEKISHLETALLKLFERRPKSIPKKEIHRAPTPSPFTLHPSPQPPLTSTTSHLRSFWQSWRAKISFKRFAFTALLLGIIITVPTSAKSYYYSLKTTKDAVAENSTAGFVALQDSTTALKQAKIASAEEATLLALQKFNSATTMLETNHRLLQILAAATPILGSEFVSRQNILLAGQEIATGNKYLLEGIKDSQTGAKNSLAKKLNTVLTHLAAALPNYTKALQNLKTVDSSTLPLEYQLQFEDFRKLFTHLLNDFSSLSDVGGSLQEIFGSSGRRRYLLVFQNPHEMRPTGGFMGSIAILDIKDGEIIKLEVPPGGSYDFQGQLNEYVEPPTPLLLSNKRWEFQDANWFPDFPTSAEKILWFYRHSRGVTADGVIAINATVLERLLGIVGPITDEKRQVTLTAENALPTIQQIVEEGPEKIAHKPKQIIADLAPRFVDLFKNLKPDSIMPLLVNLKEALEQKEVQAYFMDTHTENTIKTFGWGGHILKTTPPQDYLLVVNTNIQGQKSDAKIQQAISHQAIVETDGSIIDTVTITREHTGRGGEKLYGQTNINFLRAYVPEGSELISAQGFSWPDEKSFRTPEKWYKKDAYLLNNEKEVSIDNQSGTRVTKEFGKTAFGNWVITEPGQTSQVQFSYRLPFKLTPRDSRGMGLKKIISALGGQLADYQLIVQKQSGITTAFESQIIFPDSWRPIWKDGADITLAKNGASIAEHSLNSDAVWSVLVKEND